MKYDVWSITYKVEGRKSGLEDIKYKLGGIT